MEIKSRSLSILLLLLMWVISIPIMHYTSDPSLLNMFSIMVFYIGIFFIFAWLFFLVIENPTINIPTSVVKKFTPKPKYEVKDVNLSVPKATIKKE